jgi:hypothetical protein
VRNVRQRAVPGHDVLLRNAKRLLEFIRSDVL